MPVYSKDAARKSERVAEAAIAACPLLALVEDSKTRALFPTPHHRCLTMKERRPSLGQQASYCLTDRYFQCPTFVKHTRISAPSRLPAAMSLLVRPTALAFIVILSGLSLYLFGLSSLWLGSN